MTLILAYDLPADAYKTFWLPQLWQQILSRSDKIKKWISDNFANEKILNTTFLIEADSLPVNFINIMIKKGLFIAWDKVYCDYVSKDWAHFGIRS
jgi:hypothetical protein